LYALFPSPLDGYFFSPKVVMAVPLLSS
jgi:hypothetical protein